MASSSSTSSSTKMHLVMYPWFAFGHFIPFLNLSNELARRGHTVSLLQSLNHHLNLIHFFPLTLPQVDGLPVGAETASDVPSWAQQNHLCTAYDQCRDQLEILLTTQISAICTCQEIEASFCDYIARQYKKPVLLTGPILQETSATKLEDKWVRWLNKFEPGSVVFCAFGSQVELQKDQYQELLLGFESCGHPFLVALPPPRGCLTVEEALPGSYHRIGGVYGGWVPQVGILNHPSVWCFVSHGGSASTWESLLSNSQIVLVPNISTQIVQTRFMVEELEVAVEVERSGENRWISKESLSNAIEYVMDKTSEMASRLRSNHANLKSILSRKSFGEEYIDAFVGSLRDMKD